MIRFATFEEARSALASDLPGLIAAGISFEEGAQPLSYVPEPFKQNARLAMDAVVGNQPPLATTANAGVPALLTTYIDPEVYEILFAANRAAIIFGESRRGTWLDETAMFPTVEHTGEVSSYGDFNENGRANANTIWPQRQQYLYQTVVEYGDRELERAGLARINWVTELDKAAATVMNKYENLVYFFGVGGLQNYGLLNDPALTAAITPATKAAGGTQWILSGKINASANEVYADIENLFLALVNQTQGLVTRESRMTLALSPQSEVALTATNTFNVNVSDLLKKNFPNLRVENAVQYGQLSASNPQGIAAGNLVQLIADAVEGQATGYMAFGEKLRAHRIIPQLTSFRQKRSGGVWGAIVRQPYAIAQLLGV